MQYLRLAAPAEARWRLAVAAAAGSQGLLSSLGDACLLTANGSLGSWHKQQHRGMAAGQPVFETHPEVLDAGELLPGITASEFEARRRRLASLLPPGAAAILPAAQQAFVTGVIPYPYRQDADFLYLTGITQQAFMVLQAPHAHAATPEDDDPMRMEPPKFTLFLRAPNAERERWDGVPLRSSVAQEVFGADEVYTTNEMPSIVKQMLAGASSVYYNPESYGGRLETEVTRMRVFASSANMPPQDPEFGLLRKDPLPQEQYSSWWLKSQPEVQLMRESAKLAASAIKRCMRLTRTAKSEQFLAATFEYECRLGGAQRLAYPAVVAGGADACTIHYIRNDKMLEEGKLVLMDAGCEYWGYASDVTRTWPVGGRFTGPQREIYEAVLNIHRQCVDACRAGGNLRQIHSLSVRLISQAIAQLGIIDDTDAASVMSGSYRPFYCHSVGHWLGIDTHDTNTVAHELALQPGVVMTIEPGLYIPNDPKYGKYAGIGVRIEDDILVRADGQPPEVLSQSVPVHPDEIEALVQHGE